jgi:hypothetical protein
VISILFVLLLSGCVGYAIKYELKEPDVIVSKSKLSLSVQLAKFSDTRPQEEKSKDIRSEKGQSDVNDYTYDNEFSGNVVEEVSKMVVEHINYSKVFNRITLASFASADVSDSKLDALREKGVDVLILGDLNHFYGYYEQNIGMQLLYCIPLGVASGLLLNFSFTSGNTTYSYFWYGPGLVLGYYLESLDKRDIKYSTQLILKMVSTSTRKVLWEGTFDVSQKLYDKMPGISTQNRKFEITINSLRDAVNKIVESLSKSDIKTNQ